ncbi:MAG: hypothetical protein N2035_06510 [Chthoniobacterales bacterium]|nr:hypothetical protein [Chthoniobacterales bacterium]
MSKNVASNGSHFHPRVAVLNPNGRDPYQDYTNGLHGPEYHNTITHPPINYHAFAACSFGAFFNQTKAVLQLNPAEWLILVLLRGDYSHGLEAIRYLSKNNFRVLFAFKETGVFQVGNNLLKNRRLQKIYEICAEANGAIATASWSIPLLAAAGAKQIFYLPTPYPIENQYWNFQIPDSQKNGIFLGTREFNVLARNHLIALEIAHQIAKKNRRKITVINDGSAPRWWKKHAQNSPSYNIIPKPLPYTDYLRLMAKHEVVFQLDSSRVPGQVAGDCLLSRVLCIGGEGEIERIAFPQTCGFGREFSELAELLDTILSNPQKRLHFEKNAWLAASKISFTSTREKLISIWKQLSTG